MSKLVPAESIINKIVYLRGEKVLLDRDLAEMYSVETKQLKRAVRRNISRFPEDFMFELSKEEYQLLRSQSGTLKRGTHSKYAPMAFTEQGIAMLSSVLNSERAIEVNIAIMRAFVHLRKLVSSKNELARKLKELEMHIKDHDEQIQVIFEAIQQMISFPDKRGNKIGYIKENQANYGKGNRKN
jgi:phage regulator Rha-like protein